MLSAERKKEIIEEEKLRKRIRLGERDKGALGCLAVFVISIVVIIVIAMNATGDDSKNNIQTNTTEQTAEEKAAQAQAEAQAKEKTIDALTPVCVENHKSLFKPKIQELLDGTSIVPQSATKKGAYSSVECKQIMTGLYDRGYKKEEIQKVAEAKYWIGMDAKLLFFSVGIANNYSNSTTTIFGTSSQLVYGDPLYGATYIYLDNGVVTSFQN